MKRRLVVSLFLCVALATQAFPRFRAGLPGSTGAAGAAGPAGDAGATTHVLASTSHVNAMAAYSLNFTTGWVAYTSGGSNPVATQSDGGSFYVDPEGGTTATAVTFTSTGANASEFYISACPNAVAGVSAGMFVKSWDGGTGYVDLDISGGTDTCVRCYYDSTWSWCSATNTSVHSGSSVAVIGNIPSVCGESAVTQTVLLWHPQCEAGLFATFPAIR